MFFLDAFLKGLKPQFDDDVVDRLNYYYTPMLLVIFSLTLSAKQYVGQPIQCWIPAQFTGAWEQFSESYCFIQNTFFLPLHHYIPSDIQEREDREIGYYQWVPFVLGLQAILFYLPCLVWRVLNWQSGVAVKSLVRMSQDVGNMRAEKRKESVTVVASHIHDSLAVQRDIEKSGLLAPLLHRGRFLTYLYIVVKAIYLLQVFLQFVILNNFLSTSYTLWGIGILSDLAAGREWQDTGHFPRVTMCDFEVRELGNKHRHTVQCVLMINMFNEKVYLFIWWWLLIVAIATLFSLIYWVFISLNASKQKSFIASYLRVLGHLKGDERESDRNLSRFVDRALRWDGVFVIRLIASNAGDLITTDLVVELWKRFLEEERDALDKPSSPSAPQKSLDDVDGGFSESLGEKTPLT